jgi:hypothetical protein
MKRREFILLLGGAAAAPLAARAQQPERMRRIGVLMNLAADDPESPARITSYRAYTDWVGLLAITCRWTIGSAQAMRIVIGDSRRNWWRWRLMSL